MWRVRPKLFAFNVRKFVGWSFGEEKIWNRSAGVIHSFKDALKPALRLVVKGVQAKNWWKNMQRGLCGMVSAQNWQISSSICLLQLLFRVFFCGTHPTKQVRMCKIWFVVNMHNGWLPNSTVLYLGIYLLLCKYTNLVCVTQPSSWEGARFGLWSTCSVVNVWRGR